jgi:hypothetical protein
MSLNPEVTLLALLLPLGAAAVDLEIYVGALASMALTKIHI